MPPPAPALPGHALDHLLATLNAALQRHIHADTGLCDPLTGQSSPPDHYGHTCAALALLHGKAGQHEAAQQALRYWLAQPAGALDHLPFNRFALDLMLALHGERLDADTRALIEAGIRRCPLQRHYPSNNWTLLAQTCRLIEAAPAARPAAARRLAAQLQRWTTPQGAFIDFPRHPRGQLCTPLSYHHKALFLAALASRFCADPALTAHTIRLLEWLVHCWDGGGHAGGYGRSTHALFGDACLIAALILLEMDEGGPLERLVTRLTAQLRSDGLLWLDPHCDTRHWDAYMHLSVYNAWAAAIIGAARSLRARLALPAGLRKLSWQADRAGLFHDPEAGLAAWRDEAGRVALLSTTGQPPQAWQAGVAELRYAGATLYHLRAAHAAPHSELGDRVAAAQLQQTPALAGALPLALIGTVLHVVDRYEVLSLQATATGFCAHLRGRARPVAPPPPAGLGGRLRAALDWRLFKGALGRRAALQRPPNPALEADLRIHLSAQDGRIRVEHTLTLRHDAQVKLLNPSLAPAGGEPPSPAWQRLEGAPDGPGPHTTCIFYRCRDFDETSPAASP